MTKRILAILLCAILLCGFAGCAGRSDTAPSATAPHPEPQEMPMAYDMSNEEAEFYGEKDMDDKGVAGEVSGEVGLPMSQASDSAEKIIYTADAELETQKFDDTLTALAALLEEYGGFVESSSISGSDYYTIKNQGGSYRSAFYAYRIPADKFADFCTGVKALGNVPRFSTNAQNITSQYKDLDARLTARQTEETRLLELLGRADTVEDMLAIESKLSEVRYEIESLQSQINNYDSQVSYSTLYLNVREVTLYTNVDDASKGYGQQLADGFTATLAAVGEFFSNAFKWIVSALPVLLIIAVVGVAVLLIVRHCIKKRKAKKTAAAVPPAAAPPAEPKDKE